LLTIRGVDALSDVLSQELLERAIGVIYLPETERLSHYFLARLADQFDAVIHLDETRAVEPLGANIAMGRGRGAGDIPVCRLNRLRKKS